MIISHAITISRANDVKEHVNATNKPSSYSNRKEEKKLQESFEFKFGYRKDFI